jgi:hypothetical protein
MANHAHNTSAPTVRRRLEARAFAVPPGLRPTTPVNAAAEIPKVVSWKPGVPRSSFVPPSSKVTPEPAPTAIRPVEPPVRNKPVAEPGSFWFGSRDLLARLPYFRRVPSDILPIDKLDDLHLPPDQIGRKDDPPSELSVFLPPGYVSPSPTKTSPPSYWRARKPVAVVIHQPGDEANPGLQFEGRLLGAVVVNGAVHHYRVVGPDRTMYLCPPYWVVGTAPALLSMDDGVLMGAGS